MKIISKILTYVGIGIITAIIIILITLCIARFINAKNIKITTPNGIQENIYVNLGGIDQYIQIRGEDKNNPVIIFLHGGPGNPISHLSYYYEPYLESQYTFVNWDQRGSGKTYYRNEGLDVKSHLSTDILLNDLNDLVDYIRETLNQDKIIIMGHSWGTLLGSKYVLAHPEKVLTYIGIGQVVSLQEGYINSSNGAIKKAQEQGDTKVAQQLESTKNLFSKTNSLDEFDFNNFIKMQQYSMKYHAYEGQISTPEMLWMMITSPYMSYENIKWFLKTSKMNTVSALQEPLLNDCFFKLNLCEFGNQYEVPVHYITGEHDVSTPIELLQKHYDTIVAPDKSITSIPNTGHLVFFDDPQKFSNVLNEILLNTETKLNLNVQ